VRADGQSYWAKTSDIERKSEGRFGLVRALVVALPYLLVAAAVVVAFALLAGLTLK
jgi:hypothetical protein